MVYLGLFIIFLAVLSHYRRKHTANQDAVEDRFWQKENLANHTRRKDISGLPYINIPLDKFPIGRHENNILKDYEKQINTLSTQKILNLSSYTNTELKIAYGTANLEALSVYDQNFTTLCHALVSYAKELYALGFATDAQTVLEYGIEIGSDISQNFLLLAQIYWENGSTAQISELIEKASCLDSLMKNSIVDGLNKLLN